ncbi:hypothetical protein GUJ93_ZPchr0012g21796 [Zizania palustris]|uniref:Uncharacterized protein n=1 Tax=Zizania palustris TaxID=103762 RepID=A0A8J5WL30_ZIZPA|nr:hypothetical protein GUJ93_ZPchr0012g21796 [Zizania palustris]
MAVGGATGKWEEEAAGDAKEKTGLAEGGSPAMEAATAAPVAGEMRGEGGEPSALIPCRKGGKLPASFKNGDVAGRLISPEQGIAARGEGAARSGEAAAARGCLSGRRSGGRRTGQRSTASYGFDYETIANH